MAAALWAGLAGPAWAAGQLLVETSPPGAHVYMDDRLVGVSPVLVDSAPGHHRVLVQQRGYEPTSTSVRLHEGLTTRRQLALRPLASGALRVESTPAGALVLVDGRRRGSTPLNLASLPPGNHVVELRRAGYQGATASVSVLPGLTTTLARSLTLAPPPPPPVEARQAAAPVARVPQPAPRKIERAPQVAQAPEPAPVAPPIERVAAPPPEAPPTAEPVIAAPQPALEAAPMHDLRPIVFTGLLAGLAIGVLSWVRRRRHLPDADLTWAPPRPLRATQPWNEPGPVPQAVRRASVAMAAQQWPEAAEVLWQAQAEGLSNAWVFYHLGLALIKLERPLEAEGAFRTAQQLAPEHPAAGYNVGVVLMGLEQRAQAVVAFRRHLEAHPEDVDALFNLGHVYVALGMYAQAHVHWSAAAALAPRDAAVRTNLRWVERLAWVSERRAS